MPPWNDRAQSFEDWTDDRLGGKFPGDPASPRTATTDSEFLDHRRQWKQINK
jgi:hypothetical protein